MKHLGDITKINGAEIPIVDCITGGSPCQDLSVAGKRAGLSGERSGLFMEQLRIVKEMRKRDQDENGRTDQFIRPRFMVWENVPGAFSSNNGKDFQAVLTEIVRIVEPDAPDVPMPDKGKWTKSGCIYDEMGRWSVAWRVHDAQFWGVPQRRKRIALVADFGGLAAPEIQFERKGLSRHTEPSGTARKGTAGDPQECADGTSESVSAVPIEGNGSRESHRGNGYNESDVSFTLNSVEQHGVAYGISAYESNAMKSSNPHSGVYKAETSRTLDNNGGNPSCNQGGVAIVGVDAYNHQITGQTAATLNESSCATPTRSGPSVMYYDEQNR